MDYREVYIREYEQNTSKMGLEKERIDSKEALESFYEDAFTDENIIKTVAATAASTLIALGGKRAIDIVYRARDYYLLAQERGGVQFSVPHKGSFVTIELLVNCKDFYNLVIYRGSAVNQDKIVEIVDIYVEDLLDIFKEETKEYMKVKIL